MRCCEKCFVDRILIKHIRKNGVIGACGFCKSRRAKTISPDFLHDIFQPLISLCEPADDDLHALAENTTLPECITQRFGWSIFAESMSESVKCELLDLIRRHDPKSGDANGLKSNGQWASVTDSVFYTSEEAMWQEFTESIKWKRRFIPPKLNLMAAPKDWFPQFLHNVRMSVTPKNSYYRARLGGLEESHVVTKPFNAENMGVPPQPKSTAGRANPAGIPYLYVAEKEITALSEIRPFLGAAVTIATVRPKEILHVIDLTREMQIMSPFEHSDLRLLLERNAFLGILNRELSKPVSPALADIEYIPTQYLAEVILNAGYDGIRYKSAMNSGGFNVAFFDPAKLEILRSTRLVTVTANKIEYKPS